MMALVLLAGAGILFMGFITGLSAGKKIASFHYRPLVEAPKPICTCAHSRGEHDEGTGKCRAEHRNYLPGYGWRFGKCACMIYTGPIPVMELWTPLALPIDSEERAR